MGDRKGWAFCYPRLAPKAGANLGHPALKERWVILSVSEEPLHGFNIPNGHREFNQSSSTLPSPLLRSTPKPNRLLVEIGERP